MKVLLSIFFVFTIIACSKNETEPISEEKQLLLKEVTTNNVLIRSYEYHEDNNIKSRQYYNASGIPSWYENYEFSNDTVYRISYNSDNSLYQRKKYYDISINVSRYDTYDAENNLIKSRVYTFDENTCGFTKIEYYDSENERTMFETFEYSDENCSMNSIRYDLLGEIIGKGEWIRDAGNQFSKSTLISFFRAENLGNITAYNYWDEDDNIDLDASYQATYEYNEDNYPISQTKTNLNMEVETSYYTYF